MSRLRSVWRLLNLPCEAMACLASESLDHDLVPSERIALRAHTLYCVACRRYFRQLNLMRSAMHRLATQLENGQPLPGPRLPDDVRARIRRLLLRN